MDKFRQLLAIMAITALMSMNVAMAEEVEATAEEETTVEAETTTEETTEETTVEETMEVEVTVETETEAAVELSDIADHMYEGGIQMLVDWGWVQGHPDGTYKPETALNRAEMLKLVVEATTDEAAKAEVETYADADCFEDLQAGEWYVKYVCYGKEMGIVEGYDEGKNFKPAQTVNFVEALKMTLEAFEVEYEATADVWYKGLVEAAATYNYIPVDVAAFGEALMRGQMADLLVRTALGQMDMEAEGEATYLADYLGSRADVMVTYETIAEGKDMSEEVSEEEEMEEEMEDEDMEEDTEEETDEEMEEVETPAVAPYSLSVELGAQNESGQSGTATFLEVMNEETGAYELQVTLELTGGPEAVEQPAHVHVGTCAEIGEVKWALSSVVDGMSTTTLEMSMQDLLLELAAGTLAVNVHKSADESDVYYACGDVMAENMTGGEDVEETEVVEEETTEEVTTEEETTEEVTE